MIRKKPPEGAVFSFYKLEIGGEMCYNNPYIVKP